MPIDPREQAALDLKIARADAIHNYVAVEQSLCSLMSTLLSISQDQAGIIYFNVVASRSIHSIIDGLLEKKFGTEYDAYWNGIPGAQGVKRTPGLFALLGQLATTRNFIVHWAVGVEVGSGPVFEYLMPPNLWGFQRDPRSLRIEEMVAFSAKAKFVSGSIGMFDVIAGGLAKFAEPTPWPDIFRRPCTYPPEEGHPLAPKP